MAVGRSFLCYTSANVFVAVLKRGDAIISRHHLRTSLLAAGGVCDDGVCEAQQATSPSTISLATFDGAKGTTQQWRAVNDPVMGGQSVGTFNVSAERKVGVWVGEVKIVPFLHAPGFCNIQAPTQVPS